MQNKILLALCLLLFASISNAIEIYKGNQGIVVDKFNTNLFVGSWLFNNNKQASGATSIRHSKWVVISKAEEIILDKKAEEYRKNRDLFEFKNEIRFNNQLGQTKRILSIAISTNIQMTKEENENGKYFSYGQKEKKHLKKFKIDNISNSLVFRTYNKNKTIIGGMVYSLFNLNSAGKFYYVTRKNKTDWEAPIDDINKIYDIDILTTMDFLFVNNIGYLIGIDFITQNRFVFYNLTNKTTMVFERTQKELKTTTYDKFYTNIKEKTNR